MKEALISFSLLTKLLHSFHLFPEAFSGERKRSASSCPGASSPTVPWGAYWRRAVDFTDPAGPGGRHQLLLDHSMSAPTAGPGHELLAQRPSRGGAVPRPTPDPDLRLGPDSGLGVRGQVRSHLSKAKGPHVGVGASLFKPVLTEEAQHKKGPGARFTQRRQVSWSPRHDRTPEPPAHGDHSQVERSDSRHAELPQEARGSYGGSRLKLHARVCVRTHGKLHTPAGRAFSHEGTHVGGPVLRAAPQASLRGAARGPGARA